MKRIQVCALSARPGAESPIRSAWTSALVSSSETSRELLRPKWELCRLFAISRLRVEAKDFVAQFQIKPDDLDPRAAQIDADSQFS